MIEGIHPRRGSALTMRLRKKKSLLDQAIDQASDVVDAALPRIESAVSQVREQVRELSKDAADGAKDFAKDTKVKAAPLMAEGRSLAGDLADATREVAIPKAKAGALAGADKAASLAASGRDLAAAKLADVKNDPQPKKRSKLRKVLIFGSLAAAAGFVYNKMRPKPQADNWQSSYVPPTSTTTATTTSSTSAAGTSATGVPTTGGTHLAPGVGPDEPVGSDDPMAARAGDDSGGASPDEAIADAVEEPHEVTTPDDPAEVVDVETEAKKK
jgi:hypothetical protein